MSGFWGRKAIVVGAGMGGLAAASALTGHFEQVLVLERDALPLAPMPRAGTPQARHTHVLLGGGQRALADLLPGLEEDLERAGAVRFRIAADLRFEPPGIGYTPFPSRDFGWSAIGMSRPLIEFAVRKRLERDGRVEVRERCRVRDIVTTPDGAAASAVRYESSDGKCQMLPADLVIDATGRGVLTLDLLRSIGWRAPEKTTIGVDIAYSTAVFAIPDDAPDDWRCVVTLPDAPRSSRLAVLFPNEGNRWIVSVGGAHGDKPPAELDELLDYLRRLRTPTIYNAIKNAKPVGEIARYGITASEWRHFERLEHLPRGVLPVADAICRYNPVYGQGMSVAALEACVLRRLLGTRALQREGLGALAPAFFAEVEALIDTAWEAAAVPDLVLPETTGQRPADFEDRLRFRLALTRLAVKDLETHRLMVEVQHLLKLQSALRDPELLQRVHAVMAET
jgi:2-polyprenyl-6-methoxyphenol hydroxylase-like FAD-dependent oxidoreductase